jgi:hypothetical protein
MRILKLTLAALAGLVLLGPATADSAGRTDADDEIIVMFNAGASATTRTLAIKGALPAATIRKSLTTPSGTLVVARVPMGQANIDELLARYRADPKVRYAEVNSMITLPPTPRSTAVHVSPLLRMRDAPDADGRPTFYEAPRLASGFGASLPVEDPRFDQWGWHYVDGGVVWKSPAPGPLVALIDTGVDNKHPDLAGRVSKGPDLVNDDLDPMDDNGHGTLLAGVISAAINNKKGISGLSSSRVYAVKAFSFNGEGSVYDVSEAIRRAARLAAPVILIGFGTPTESVTLREAVNFAVNSKGKLLIAAAGDDASTTRVYPAAYSTWDTANGDPYTFVNRVLAVGAQGVTVTPSGGGANAFVEYCQAPYSNYGSWVNLVAPGTDIYSTTPYNRDFYNRRFGDTVDGYNAHSSTALAAAYVAAIAARTWAVEPGRTNTMTAQDLTGQGTYHALTAFTGAVDVDNDGTDDIQGCWDPTWANPGTPPDQRAVALADANIAMAMDRSSIWVLARDAYTGLPLTNTWGIILNWGRPDLRREGEKMPPGSDRVIIPDAEWHSNSYIVRMWNWLYTNGPTSVDTVHLSYRKIWHQLRDISIPQPQSNNINVVANWGYSKFGHIDMDLHLLFPLNKTTNCDIGDEPALAIDPASYCGRGSMRVQPFTQLMSESSEHKVNNEAIQIKQPMYLTNVDPYRIYLQDSDPDGLNIIDPERGWPVVRVWLGGVMKRLYEFGHSTGIQGGPHAGLDPPGTPCTFIPGGTAHCSIWDVAESYEKAFYDPVDILGDGTEAAVIPFGGSGGGTTTPVTTPSPSTGSSSPTDDVLNGPKCTSDSQTTECTVQ